MIGDKGDGDGMVGDGLLRPEISGVIKEEDFVNVFEYATSNKHDALIIDQISKHIFKLNWDTALILN